MFKVCEKQCDQCLFSKNRIVSKERVKEILETCKEDDSFFICHKATIAGDHDVCCRGFYEHGNYPTLQQVAERLNMIEFVPVPGDEA